MATRITSLKEILIDEGIIDKEGLEALEVRAKQAGKYIEQTIIESKLIEKNALLQLLSARWGVKAVDLESLEIDEDAIRLVPETSARRYLILPFAKAETELFTAMSRPWDITAIEDLHLRTGYDIKPYLSLPGDIIDHLNKVFNQDSKISDFISTMSSGNGAGSALEDAEEGREEISFKSMSESDEKQARKIVNAIFLEGLAKGASDFHIEPFEHVLLLRYRVDGQLQESSFKVSKTLTNALLARIKIMSHSMDITERRLPQDGRIQITYQKRPVEFRVNIIPTAYGESCVMRVLDRTSIKVDLPKLGFLHDTLEKFKEVLKKPYGIILVCGPTGSGKSTTLYSALNYLLIQSKILPNGETLPVSPKKIITAENPVEYDLAEVIQLNINPDIGLHFAEAMKAFLRQDPDVIMVGEVRDRETAQIAMEAALTGHLVLSTIHTNDAATAVSRLAEMQVPQYLISSSVEAVLAQRLIRTLCECRKPMENIPDKLMGEFDRLKLPHDKLKVFGPGGCKKCGDSGYKGRSGIHELLIFDAEIRELLLTQISSGPIAKLAVKKGMRQLWGDGIIKIAMGKTTYEELLRVSQ